ncbi:hypothetical protein GCM10010266_35920 [Streptomyces griseomycini]|nr:hypothetical protein GCM10010266_35920 [Streptomyces griseomycini]
MSGASGSPASVPDAADRDPADAGARDEPVEDAGGAHRVDHAAVPGGRDQVTVRLLRPALTGGLPLPLPRFPTLLEDTGAGPREREHSL